MLTACNPACCGTLQGAESGSQWFQPVPDAAGTENGASGDRDREPTDASDYWGGLGAGCSPETDPLTPPPVVVLPSATMAELWQYLSSPIDIDIDDLLRATTP